MTDIPMLEEGLADRFWAKVQKGDEDECWPWTGSSNAQGRGAISVGGRVRVAPQVSWEISHGAPFPTGKVACHSCDNPSCVNPKHIWAGTQRENLIDCRDKGRIKQKPQQFCVNGHDKSGANGYAISGRGVACRICKAASDVRRQQRLRERAEEAAAITGYTPQSAITRRGWVTRRARIDHVSSGGE